MKKIVIWGGNGRPLRIDQLDSHASVTAYFLTKYLSPYYRIVNITDSNAPEDILNHPDACAVLSTFQRGFTNLLISKGKKDIFLKIRSCSKGFLCSVYDYNHNDVPYYEDMIFTVRPLHMKNILAIQKRSYNPKIRMVHMGWCADQEFCFPERVNETEVNIFIDHPPYSNGGPDYSPMYHKVFSEIQRDNPALTLRVYQQDNDGITHHYAAGTYHARTSYQRKNKVPWQEIVSYYRRMDIFCITTPQSACLSAIEAAMCGAKLYIPTHCVNRHFIPNDLLDGSVAYQTFRFSWGIARALRRDIGTGFDRNSIHAVVSRDHGWQKAAERIHEALMKGV